jgi:hypothetical protein
MRNSKAKRNWFFKTILVGALVTNSFTGFSQVQQESEPSNDLFLETDFGFDMPFVSQLDYNFYGHLGVGKSLASGYRGGVKLGLNYRYRTSFLPLLLFFTKSLRKDKTIKFQAQAGYQFLLNEDVERDRNTQLLEGGYYINPQLLFFVDRSGMFSGHYTIGIKMAQHLQESVFPRSFAIARERVSSITINLGFLFNHGIK